MLSNKNHFLPDLEVIKVAVGVVLHVKDGKVEQDLLANGHTGGGLSHLPCVLSIKFSFPTTG